MPAGFKFLAAAFFLSGAALHAREWATSSSDEKELSALFEKAKASAGEDTTLVIRHSIALTKTMEFWWPGPGAFTLVGEGEGEIRGDACGAGVDALAIGGPDIAVRGLRISGSGSCAIRVGTSGRYHIEDCRITGARGGGIAVWNPQDIPRAAGAPQSLIRGNLVERFNQSGKQWANDGISVADDDVVIAWNTVRDCAAECMGLRIMGRSNRVERNRVERVGHGDSGGIYLWGGERIYEFLGNEILDNAIAGVSRGIYLDDCSSGAVVRGNSILDATVAGIFIGGGRDNVIEDNLIARCALAVHIDNRGVGWPDLPEKAALWKSAREQLARVLGSDGEHARRLRERLETLCHMKPEEITDDYSRPAGNRIAGNRIAATPRDIEGQDYTRGLQTPEEFLAWNAISPSQRLPEDSISDGILETAGHEARGAEGDKTTK